MADPKVSTQSGETSQLQNAISDVKRNEIAEMSAKNTFAIDRQKLTLATQAEKNRGLEVQAQLELQRTQLAQQDSQFQQGQEAAVSSREDQQEFTQEQDQGRRDYEREMFLAQVERNDKVRAEDSAERLKQYQFGLEKEERELLLEADKEKARAAEAQMSINEQRLMLGIATNEVDRDRLAKNLIQDSRDNVTTSIAASQLMGAVVGNSFIKMVQTLQFRESLAVADDTWFQTGVNESGSRVDYTKVLFKEGIITTNEDGSFSYNMDPDASIMAQSAYELAKSNEEEGRTFGNWFYDFMNFEGRDGKGPVAAVVKGIAGKTQSAEAARGRVALASVASQMIGQMSVSDMDPDIVDDVAEGMELTLGLGEGEVDSEEFKGWVESNPDASPYLGQLIQIIHEGVRDQATNENLTTSQERARGEKPPPFSKEVNEGRKNMLNTLDSISELLPGYGVRTLKELVDHQEELLRQMVLNEGVRLPPDMIEDMEPDARARYEKLLNEQQAMEAEKTSLQDSMISRISEGRGGLYEAAADRTATARIEAGARQ